MSLAQWIGLALGVPVVLGLLLRRTSAWWLPSLLPALGSVFVFVELEHATGGRPTDAIARLFGLICTFALFACSATAFAIAALARHRYEQRVHATAAAALTRRP